LDFHLTSSALARAHKADETFHFLAANLLLGHVNTYLNIEAFCAPLPSQVSDWIHYQKICARLLSPIVFAQHSASSCSQVFSQAGWNQQF